MNKTKRIVLLLILLSVLPLISLFTPGLPVTHDGQDHVVRIANFYQSLSEGIIIPRWASNLNWGFGHPILMFLYPLPSYLASLFHTVGFSFIDSMKLVFGLSYIASILCMFFWVNDVWGKEEGIAAAILYGFAPYRFVDLYVRGAIGEHVAFVFLPIILWGLYAISQHRKQCRWIFLLSFGIVGLLLSHNAVSLMMIPIAFFYFLYLGFFETKRKTIFVLNASWSVLLGFLIAGSFWIPAFFEGKYTLRDIVTNKEVLTRLVSPSWFFYSPWKFGGGNEFTKEIGIVHWLSISFSVLAFFKSKKRTNRVFIAGILLLFALSLVFMTEATTFLWSHIKLMQNFQFPWRILNISMLLSSISVVLWLSHTPNDRKKVILTVLILLSIFSTVHMWKPKEYRLYPESYFTSIYKGTTDTGESSPIWSVRFMEYQPEKVAEVSDGSAEILSIKRTTTEREYKILAKEKSRIIENTLYFPGWVVLVDNVKVPVEFQDQHWRGRITYWIDEGEHTVRVIFTNTKLRTFAECISILGLILSAITFIYLKKTYTRNT